jgi:phosphate-selective porin OprO/OprP
MKKILVIAVLISVLAINTPSKASAQSFSKVGAKLKALENKLTKYALDDNSPLLHAFETTKLHGTLHMDSRWHDGDTSLSKTQADGVEITAARLGVTGKLAPEVGYKFENDFSDNGSKVKDAYITYDGIKKSQFKIGHFRQPFSLDRLTNLNNTTFLDRSVAISDAPNRSMGLQGATHGKDWQITTGIFGKETSQTSISAGSEYSFATRASYVPINTADKLIHLGLALNLSSKNISSTYAPTGSNTVDTQSLYGTEFAIRLNSLSIQGEYIFNNTTYNADLTASPTAIPNGATAHYNSYYLQTSYMLTGEKRVYDIQSGTFKNIKVKKTVDSGSIGAIELATRFSNQDKNDEYTSVAINNGKVNQISLAINWYLNDNVRIMLNYISNEISIRDGAINPQYNAVLARAQLNF